MTLPPALEPTSTIERKLVTVVFADVTGFTSLGERLDPEDLRSFQDRFFARMREAVEHESGHVEKYIGDAVVAVFGVPAVREDDAARALRCALRMREAVTSIDVPWTAVGANDRSRRLGIRIGVNTGQVVTDGQPRPDAGLVTGDVVNVAARLQQAARPGQILVGERTALAVRGFRLRSLGERRLRGRERGLRAWDLEAELRPEHGGGPPASPFIGREAELEALRQAITRGVAESRPAVVWVLGEPGAGKTRLVAEVLGSGSAKQRTAPPPGDPLVLRGRCRPPGEAHPDAPLAEILRAWAGTGADASSVEVAAAVRRLVDRVVPDLGGAQRSRMALALGWGLGLDDPDQPLSKRSPRGVRAQVTGAWQGLLSGAVEARPVLLVIDDLHWAEPGLLTLLADLVRQVIGPLTWLCLSRPEHALERRWPADEPRAIRFDLAPLDAALSARLLATLSPTSMLSERARSRMVERAGGNPFFLEEMARSLEHLGDGSVDAVLPDSVQAVLAARIDRLAVDEKRVLQAAAVSGESAWPPLLQDLTGIDAERLPQIVARLVEGALLVRHVGSDSAAGETGFRHALIREVAYDGLSRRQRAVAHERAASWLEHRPDATTDGSRQRLVARHLAAAVFTGGQAGIFGDKLEGIRRRAFGALLEAGRGASMRLALGQAERDARDAVELAVGATERAQALALQGEVALAGFDGDRAWQLLSEAALTSAIADPSDHETIARLCAKALESPARWGAMSRLPAEPDARRIVQLGLGHVGSGDGEARARLLSVAAAWPLAFPTSRVTRSALVTARRQGDEAIGICQRLDRPDLLVAAIDGRIVTAFARGRYREMRALSEQRLAVLPRVDDPREIEDAHAMAAQGAFHEGRYLDAFALADEGVRRSIAVAPLISLYSLEWRLLARAAMGDADGVEEDLALADSILPEAEGAGNPGFRRRPWAAAALARERAGDAEGAARSLARMTPMAEPSGPSRAPDSSAALGRADDVDDAGTTVRDHGPAFEDDAEPDPAASWLARRLALLGRWAEAWALLRVPRAPHLQEDAGLLLEAACELTALERAWHRAPEMIDAARMEARRGGLLCLAARADELAGLAARARGDMPDAARFLGRAAAAFERCGARPDAERAAVALGA